MRKDKQSKNREVEFEISFYEKILEKRPNFVDALKVLAELYTKSGRYKKGLQLDKRLTGLLPCDSVVYYNLACSYSLIGDIDNSLKAICKAIDLGYDDFSYMNSDPDLNNLKQDRRFEDLFSQKSRRNNHA